MPIHTFILACAPLVSPSLMAGIVEVSSQGQPWAIYRDDTAESIHPASEAEAVATALRLLGQHVAIKGGLTQLASSQWEGLNLTANNVFSPCANLAAAEERLVRMYTKDVGDVDAALSRFGADDDPLAGIKSGYVAAVKAAATAAAPGGPKERGDQKVTPAGRRDTLPVDSFTSVQDGFAGGR